VRYVFKKLNELRRSALSSVQLFALFNFGSLVLDRIACDFRSHNGDDGRSLALSAIDTFASVVYPESISVSPRRAGQRRRTSAARQTTSGVEADPAMCVFTPLGPDHRYLRFDSARPVLRYLNPDALT